MTRRKPPARPALTRQERADMAALFAMLSAVDPRPSVNADGSPGPCIWNDLARDMQSGLPPSRRAIPVARFAALMAVLEATRACLD